MTDKCLAVNLPSWTIQDGYYSDFHRGDETTFALQFEPAQVLSEIDAGATPSRALTHKEGSLYRVVGQVAHVGRGWYVLDAGVLLYTEDRTGNPMPRLGAWLGGSVYLTLDPLSELDELSLEEYVPSIVYDWSIEKIEVKPMQAVKPVAHDTPSWREIPATDAINHGEAEYLLHCKPISEF